MRIVDVRQGNPAVAIVQVGTTEITAENGVVSIEPVLKEILFWPELLEQWPAANVREMILSEAGGLPRRTFLENLKAHFDGLANAADKVPDQAKATGLRERVAVLQAEIDAIPVPVTETDLSVLIG